MLYPRYVNELTDVRKLHEIYTFDTRTIINEMMPKFYDYIVASELAENPYTAPHAVTKEDLYLYFNKDTVGEPITYSRGGNILRESVVSEFKVFCNAEAAHASIKNEDILTWYKERQIKFPILSCLATIIFKIPSSQAKNRKDL